MRAQVPAFARARPDDTVSDLNMAGRLNRGGSSEWFTPPHVFTALGVEFDIDVCAPLGGVEWIPARRFFSAADDGLSQPWEGRVWMNPPYGRALPTWTDRMAQHAEGVALVFARTDTAWFHRAVETASALCFIRGRLSFIGPAKVGHNAAASSVLIGYGSCADAVHDCGLGLSVRLDAQERATTQLDLMRAVA